MLINSVNVLQLAHLKSKFSLQARLSKKVLFSTFFIVSILLFQTTFLSQTISSQEASSQKPQIQTSQSSCPELSDFQPDRIHQDRVKWIPDGDTIHTEKGFKLRLLHINAPELNPTNNSPAEPLAKASLNKLKQLTTNPKIYWIYDKRQRDRYKRELVLLFNQQGLFINYQLVAAGMAQTLVVPPNQKYWQCIQLAEQTAKKASKGIWANIEETIKSPKILDKNSGFQQVQGVIRKIVDSKKYRWLILDNYLWVGIKRKDMQYFKPDTLKYRIGDILRLRGYVYESYGQLRMNLRHPAMLLP